MELNLFEDAENFLKASAENDITVASAPWRVGTEGQWFSSSAQKPAVLHLSK